MYLRGSFNTRKSNMDNNKLKNPAYLFEVSWEVCNKVGGIHTVISTKALNMEKEYSSSHILIGPDVWRYTEQNPEFIDDPRLFRSWRQRAAQEGLRIKVGRWNVAGKPIVILVDFSTFITQKDEIFASFWEKYKLDSISGQWDYIEPALFGYAAGKVIESFVRFNSSIRQRIIAQFHEWMTGAGLLYLKSAMPQVGCVFTTHATVLGRCVAGNNLPLYSEMKNYVPEELARRFNVISKQSLEKTAAHQADCFTTVSEITATECAHFLDKEVDLVTPNGFENVFTPSEAEWEGKRKAGREKFLQVAQAILGRPVAEDALILGISGRYEFKNKGIDVFIDAMGQLNRNNGLGKEVLAFILVPAGHAGANKELLHNLELPYQAVTSTDLYLTHYLNDSANDPVMNRIRAQKLRNSEEDKVKIFFVPSYLNGDDGVFNMPYYDLLVGMDLTAFPSYYEPWGYTPLESLAFKVPTITTTLAGFGLWVKEHYNMNHPGIEVIHREDGDASNVATAIAEWVKNYTQVGETEMQKDRDNAKDVSRIALWDNLINYYKNTDEPTVIFLTGDHQPRIHDESMDSITNGEWRNWNDEEMMRRYEVPFLIWANYDIDKKTVEKTSMNYLQTILMETIDGELTGFQKFQQDLQKEIPVLTSNGYWGADGKFYSVDDKNSPYYDLIQEYAMLQYNDMTDYKNRVEDFFELKQ